MAIESARMAASNEESMLNKIKTAYIVLADDKPEDYDMAMKSPNSNEWKMACQKEIDTLRSYDTLELVMPLSSINIIGSPWIFGIKQDNLGNINIYKARLVAQGFSQTPGINFNETFPHHSDDFYSTYLCNHMSKEF